MAEWTDIAGILAAAKRGDTGAESQLFARLYEDLRHLAHQRLRRSKPCTLLETTALVHETYLRLHQAGYIQIADRTHFLAYAARAMRSVVVDFVRKRGAAQREVDVSAVPDPASDAAGAAEILRVDEALRELARVSERLVRVVEMRYFAGMNEAEIADVLSLTDRTVRRDWEKARMLLAASLK